MSDAQKWLVLASVVLTGWLIALLAPVLTPFLAGALIAYLGTPLVDRLQAWRLKRTLAVALVFVVFFLVLVLILIWLVPLIERQVSALLARAPQDLAWLSAQLLPWLESRLGIAPGGLDVGAISEAARAHWREAGGVATQVLGVITSSGMALLGWLANLVLIPLVSFYLLRDWHELIGRIGELIPRRAAPLVIDLARQSDDMLGAFLRGQMMVMAALALIYSVGLWLTGLEQALLIGLLAGLVSFVPYLGLVVGVAAAGLAALLQTHELWMLLPVIAVFSVGQLLEGMVLTPWLVGDRIGLHPLAVIFAVLAGGQLFGFVGVLLALPVAAVLAVLLRHAHQRYLESPLYQAEV